MKKKKLLYIALLLVILSSVALGYKYYCNYIVTEYIQVVHYPSVVKLYSTDREYNREYDNPEIKVSIKDYENDSIAFSKEHNEATDNFETLKEVYEEDFLEYLKNRKRDSPHYAKASFYYKEAQKEIFLIKFEHPRMFDKETFLKDIKEIGIDVLKLEEYMKQKNMTFKFFPAWSPDFDKNDPIYTL